MTKRLRQIAKYFLLVALLLVSLSSFGIYIHFRQAEIPVTLSRLEQATIFKTQQLNRWFTNFKTDFIQDAKEPSILANATILLTPSLKFKPEYQQAYHALKQHFARLQNSRRTTSILTNGGIIVFSTDPSREGQYQPLQNTTTYFTLNNINNAIPNFYESSITHEPMMTFATPLFSPEGRRLGALAVDLNLKNLDRLIREPINTLEESTNSTSYLGQTGETYLVGRLSLVANAFLAVQDTNNEKKLHYRSQRSQIINNPLRQETIQAVDSEGITQAIQGLKGTGLYLNYNKVPVLGAFRWIPQYNLALLVEVAQAEVFIQAQKYAALVFNWGLGLSLVVSIALIFLTK